MTDDFIRLATRLIVISLIPLSIGICLDFYLVSRLIIHNSPISFLIAIILFVLFMLLWIILPRTGILQQILGNER